MLVEWKRGTQAVREDKIETGKVAGHGEVLKTDNGDKNGETINSENEVENLVVDENMERVEEIKIRNTGQEMIEENLPLANKWTRHEPKPLLWTD